MTTGIEWTDETWSPTVGCSRVSPGCDGCYAEREARRQARNPDYDGVLDDERRWSGRVNCLPDRLEKPLHWRKPRRVFVDSMSDLFHPDVPDDFIGEVFGVMAACPQHTFQVLTKRPQRMSTWVLDRAARLVSRTLPRNPVARVRDGAVEVLPQPLPPDAFLPNVWLGVSAETQRYADLRIPHLLATPAAVRFVSAEPLLGPVDLARLEKPLCDVRDALRGSFRDGDDRLYERGQHQRLHWVIVGGETGPNARPMHPQWARAVRDQCTAEGVPFFFKQWGNWTPDATAFGGSRYVYLAPDGSPSDKSPPESQVTQRVGKKRAGRLLDGRTWDEYPEAK